MLHESNIKLLILLGIFVCLLTVVLCADCRTPYAQAAYASADDSADEIYNDEVSVDPFYAKSNTEALRRSAKQIEDGKVVIRSMKELEDLANE